MTAEDEPARSERGWWRRLSAADVSAWDTDDELARLRLEVKAVRRQHTQQRKAKRRFLRRAAS